MKYISRLTAISMGALLIGSACSSSQTGIRDATSPAAGATTTVPQLPNETSTSTLSATYTVPVESSNVPAVVVDPLNFTYPVVCGRFESVSVVSGSWSDATDPLDPVSVSVVPVRTLDYGRQLVSFDCIVGPSGAGGYAGLVLLGATGDLLDVEYFEPGTNFSATSDVEAIAEVPVFAADDPTCCPSGMQQRVVVVGATLDMDSTAEDCIGGSIDLMEWGSRDYPSEEVKVLQQALLDARFSPGEVDGYWGPNSDEALLAWIQPQSDWYLIYDIDSHVLREAALSRLGILCE